MSSAAVAPVSLRAGRFRWHLLPQHEHILLGPDGLRLYEWLREGQARIIKHGPHRTVYRVTLPELTLYVKHFHLGDMRAWLRELIRSPKARMEYERALAVASCGIPTVTPLGYGVASNGPQPGESILITHSLDDTKSLSHFLEDTLPSLSDERQARVRLGMARELARLIARMHDSGIRHRDLHAANILVGLDENDTIRLHVIDLHAVRVGGPLRWCDRRANLVLLNRWFVLRASRSDRLRFWKEYTSCSHVMKFPERRDLLFETTRDLEQRTWLSNLVFWRHRDRRCLEKNRRYGPIRAPAARGYAVRDLDQTVIDALCADPNAPFQEEGVRLLKNSASATVAELEILVEGSPRKAIYKRFRVKSPIDPWLTLARPTPALRSWIYGHGLRERCLPTARPLLIVHRQRHGLWYEGYLLTEKIESAVDLHQWLANLQRLDPHARRVGLRCLIDRVSRLVRDLHQRCLSHRDLKAGNILVSSVEKPLDPVLWLIDLVGVRRYRELPRSRRLQNLTRFHASFHQSAALTRTDKLRFLRAYMQWTLFGKETWKDWWKNIEHGTLAKIAKNRRNGRPLL